MKEPQEVFYMCHLFSFKGGCKSDIERFCGVTERNHNFRVWLDELINDGVLNANGHIDNSERVIFYIINKKAMLKKLRSMDSYKNYKLLFFFDYESW